MTTNKKLNRKEAYNLAIELRKEGKTVYYIAEGIGRSKSTVYRYLAEHYKEIRLPSLKAEIKQTLLCGNFNQYINYLDYKDLTLISKEFGLCGYDKISKILNIINYFKHFSILGLYPDNLSRLDIKKAFRQKAKETHPDLNKQYGIKGKEFQAVYESYEYLMTIY